MFANTTQITEYRTDSKLWISIHRPEYNYLTFSYGAPIASDCRCISHNESSLHKYVHDVDADKFRIWNYKSINYKRVKIAECL